VTQLDSAFGRWEGCAISRATASSERIVRPHAAIAYSARLALIGCLTAVIAGSLASAARAGDRIYYGNAGDYTIRFVNLDGTGGGKLDTGSAPVQGPYGTALDLSTGRIYWTDYDTNKISYARLDGTGGGTLNTGSATVKSPDGLAIDPLARKIYWADYGANKISFARLDAPGGGDLVTGTATVNGPEGVAVDAATRKIYWANATGSLPVSFARLDGTGGGDLTPGTAIVSEPYGIAIDPTAGRAYWANYGGADRISFVNLDNSGGGDFNTATALVHGPIGVALDPSAGKLYWANYVGNKLSFARLDNSGGGGDLNAGGATVTAPDFPVLLEVPRRRLPPAISGGSVVGVRLACSRGVWAADIVAAFLYRAPQSFSHQWSRNGKNILGATGNSYKATAAGIYGCRVSATNAAGTAMQTSAPHKVFAKAKIRKAEVDPAAHSARFSFKARGGGNGFQCALVKRKRGKGKRKKPSFSACKSPKTYKKLKPGTYTFEVRALSAAGAGPAAKKTFKI